MTILAAGFRNSFAKASIAVEDKKSTRIQVRVALKLQTEHVT